MWTVVCAIFRRQTKETPIAMRMRLAPIVIHHPAVRELSSAAPPPAAPCCCGGICAACTTGPIPAQRSTAARHRAPALLIASSSHGGAQVDCRARMILRLSVEGLVEEKVEVADGNAIKSTDELPSSTEKPCVRAASRERRQRHAFVVCRGGGSERAHQQHPRQNGALKVEARRTCASLVLARPDVDHHEGERRAEKGGAEMTVDVHQRAAKRGHQRKVGAAA